MPDRIVRAGILSSEPVNGLSWAAEVLYRRLLSVVDDFGRYDARPTMLRAHLYPLKIDRVSDADVGKWLTECVTAGLVSVYQVSGQPYLSVAKFGQRVRAEKSKWPDPPAVADICQQPRATAAVFVSAVVSEGVGDSARGAAQTRGKKSKTSMPDTFGISDRVSVWAKENGYGNLQGHLDAFRRKCAANSYVYADWDAAFMEAIREDWAKLRGRTKTGAAPEGEGAAAEWWETRAGANAKAQELGQARWDETEPFNVYRDRLKAVAQERQAA